MTGRSNMAVMGLVLAMGLAAPVAIRAAPVRVEVHADRPGPRIDRDIFGQFAEHLGTGIYGGVWVGPDSPIPNVRGIRKDVVAALRAIRVPNVRWPGGCFADEYHWRKGIGPQAKRPATLNAGWGGVIEPNSFGTHEFMDFVGQIGAEAFISVNVGSGTVEEAADWFEYLTSDKPTALAKERAANGHPAPYKIKYLGLGNENWGCGGSMSPDHYVEEMKRFARYTRNYNPAQAETDKMQRVAVGSDAQDFSYVEAVMKAWKAKTWAWDIESVSLHSYTVDGFPAHLPSTGFGEEDYAKVLKETIGMDGLLIRQSEIMDRYDPEKKVSIAVDEWGVWLGPNPGSNPGFLQQENSLRDAVVAALNLNIFFRHADRVRITNIAQMVNVLQAMILTDGPKMVLTPTYHVYKLYVPFQDATFVPVSYDAGRYVHGKYELPALDAVAARDKAGRLWVAVTNVDPNQPATIQLSVAGARPRTVAGQVLTAARVDAINSFATPDAVVPRAIAGQVRNGVASVTLPPKSIAVVALD